MAGLLSISASNVPPAGTSPIASLAELRQAVAGLANYDGLYATFRGQTKRRAYRIRPLLITGAATLPFLVAG